MKTSFATLWAGLPARIKLRFATAGIRSVAEEISDLPSAERTALLTAADAPDAPDALVRRTALVRAYINERLGGIPEDRELEAELAALIGLDPPTDTSNVSVTQVAVPPSRSEAEVEPTTVGDDNSQEGRGEPAVEAVVAPRPVPTSPIPGTVTPIAEKISADRACEAHENALAEANANTPARKPERIVPQPVVAEKRNGVPLEAHQRLREAHMVMSVVMLDRLLSGSRCFITGRRFREGDKVSLVNHKLLASYELVKQFGRGNGWSWISIPLAKDCLADWEIFAASVQKATPAEKRLATLRERLEIEDGHCKGGNLSADLTRAYFWCHLLKVAIMMEEHGIQQSAADAEKAKRRAEEDAARKKATEERASNAEEAAKARVVLEDELRAQFTTRALIKARQKAISARHGEIKAELEGLHESIMDAAEKAKRRSTLKTERDALGQEFEIISGFWGDLAEEERPATSFRVTDSARKTPVVRHPGKTARKKSGKGGTTDSNSSVEQPTHEERGVARQKAIAAEESARADRKTRKAEQERRRSDPRFGEAKKASSAEPKKGKSDATDGKPDRRAAKKAVRHQR